MKLFGKIIFFIILDIIIKKSSQFLRQLSTFSTLLNLRIILTLNQHV